MRVVVEELAFGYNTGALLFEGVNFQLDVGETLAVIAPSGRGKSTLLQLLSGYLNPLRGTVEIDGSTTNGPRTDVAWIFQSSTLLPHRSALDNTILPLLARGIPRTLAEQTGRGALESVGMDKKADQSAESLSGGEAQRIGVARGLLWPAALVLADEPTANLDRANAAIITDAIFSVSASAPVIVVTHDHDVAREASRVLDLTDHSPRSVR